jgi:ribosomal protein S27AE
MTSPAYTKTRCNAYGAENPGGHPVAFGGFLAEIPVAVANICTNEAVHRFRWVCACNHQGSIVRLCMQHYYEFTGDERAPWNVRRDVQACPRCASLAPTPEQQHKCAVRLVTVS